MARLGFSSSVLHVLLRRQCLVRLPQHHVFLKLLDLAHQFLVAAVAQPIEKLLEGELRLLDGCEIGLQLRLHVLSLEYLVEEGAEEEAQDDLVVEDLVGGVLALTQLYLALLVDDEDDSSVGLLHPVRVERVLVVDELRHLLVQLFAVHLLYPRQAALDVFQQGAVSVKQDLLILVQVLYQQLE